MRNAEKVLAKCRQRFSDGRKFYSGSLKIQKEDYRFYHGTSDNGWQWPPMSRRRGQDQVDRPKVTINLIRPKVNRIMHESIMDLPTISVIPAGDDSNYGVSMAYEGLIRKIEYDSNARSIWRKMVVDQGTRAVGYVRLETEYDGPDSFDQKLVMRAIANPFNVVMDPMVEHVTGSDAKWCFVMEDITKDEFKERYPNVPVEGMSDTDHDMSVLTEGDSLVTIADYYWMDTVNEKRYLWSDGTITRDTSYPEDSMPGDEQPVIVARKKVESNVVRFIKTNGKRILSEGQWVGDSIPIVRVAGDISSIDGEMQIVSLITYSKDPQKMYNFWQSQEAELLAMSSIAPFMAYDRTIEPYEDDWRRPEDNPPVLLINSSATDAAGNLLPPPRKLEPPSVSPGFMAAEASAEKNISQTIGVNDAFVGEQGAEQGNQSVFAAMRATSLVVSNFGENLREAVEEVGRKLIQAIPMVYDTRRKITLPGDDAQASMVIDPDAEHSQEVMDMHGPKGLSAIHGKEINLTQGSYIPRVTAGPDEAIKRRAGLAAAVTLGQTNPEKMWSTMADILYKDMDWPSAQKAALRIQKTMDPSLLDNTSAQDSAIRTLKDQLKKAEMKIQQLMSDMENTPRAISARAREQSEEIKRYDAVTNRLKVLDNLNNPNIVRDQEGITVGSGPDQGSVEQQVPQQANPNSELLG